MLSKVALSALAATANGFTVTPTDPLTTCVWDADYYTDDTCSTLDSSTPGNGATVGSCDTASLATSNQRRTKVMTCSDTFFSMINGPTCGSAAASDWSYSAFPGQCSFWAYISGAPKYVIINNLVNAGPGNEFGEKADEPTVCPACSADYFQAWGIWVCQVWLFGLCTGFE